MKSRKHEEVATGQIGVRGVGLVGSECRLATLSVRKLLVNFFTIQLAHQLRHIHIFFFTLKHLKSLQHISILRSCSGSYAVPY